MMSPILTPMRKRISPPPRGHLLLHLDRAAHRFDGAGELDQHAVAGGLDDAPAAFGDLGIDDVAQRRLEARQRPFLVRFHQTGIADHIGGEYGR